jgi:hypothetical protein
LEQVLVIGLYQIPLQLGDLTAKTLGLVTERNDLGLKRLSLRKTRSSQRSPQGIVLRSQ